MTSTPAVIAPGTNSGLPSAAFANTVPIAGVRHVALDAIGTAAVEEIVRSALLNPGTAVFDAPFIGAETGIIVRVCGTVSASVAGQRSDGVPFVVTLDYSQLSRTLPGTDAVTLDRLGGSIGWQGPYTASNAEIAAFCRDQAGVILPVD
jgi:hypothetical protein